MSLGEVGSQAWENLGPSAKQYGSDWASTFTDPVGTAKSIGQTAVGGMQKLKDSLGIPTTNVFGDQRASAEAAGEFFVDRLGGWENIKRTIATDPVGAVADLATVLSGGALAGARLPGIAGQVARVSGTVGKALDPASAAARGVGILGKNIAAPVATGVLGMTTGAGPTAIRTAATCGDGRAATSASKFRAAMRGQMPMEEVVNSVKSALGNMYSKRSEAYRSGMKGVDGDPEILDFGKVHEALADVMEVKMFKGVPISPSTHAIRNEVTARINKWHMLDPAEYHTVEGFDALKQSIGDILESTQYGTPDWKIANQAYHAIKETITDQAPGYAKVMEDYTQATALLQEIQKELSLGKKGTPATAMRKLQAIIRDDVSSAYGRRAELGAKLEAAGAHGLTESLAGQSMSSILPRGLRGAVTSTTGLGAIASGGLNPAAIGGGLAYGMASSPRVVGEVAHAAGRAVAPGVEAARTIARYTPKSGLAQLLVSRPFRWAELRPLQTRERKSERCALAPTT